uniref:DAP3 binding cell death enhancer 1 n=1 Tax=Ornithorhynchus anatinus TaxID=9258 RepID=A0A6I8NLL6_ORNAN
SITGPRRSSPARRPLKQAFPRLPEPGFREVTTRLPSQDEPASVSSPRPGPARREPRRPPARGWTCRWLSSRHLPPTAWDALSWGALAVLALQLARQVHFRARSLRSGGTEPEARGAPPSCARSPARRLPQDFALRRNVPPEARALHPPPTGARDPGADPPPDPPDGGRSRTAEPRRPRGEEPSDGFFLDVDAAAGLGAGADQDRAPDAGRQEKAGPEGSVEEAALSLQKLYQLSVALVLNVLGTESMRQGRCGSAFSCFLQAAARGYAKAQYNAGLCLELGRGTRRDLSQALLYYERAASRGHLLAQYRYARCLLREPAAEAGHRGASSALERLAEGGLTEVTGARGPARDAPGPRGPAGGPPDPGGGRGGRPGVPRVPRERCGVMGRGRGGWLGGSPGSGVPRRRGGGAGAGREDHRPLERPDESVAVSGARLGAVPGSRGGREDLREVRGPGRSLGPGGARGR